MPGEAKHSEGKGDEEGKDAERCTPLLISTPPLAQSPEDGKAATLPRSAAADRVR